MRLLFVSHTRSYSGAEVAMMRLVTALMGSHEVAVASPLESRIADEAKARAMPYYAVPAIDLSLRMDAVETTTGLAQLARGASACSLQTRQEAGWECR